MRSLHRLGLAAALGLGLLGAEDTISTLTKQFEPSAISVEARQKELAWFQKAAQPLKGLKIRTVAESISTHTWESEVLAKAFTELTGIEVSHTIMGEGDLVGKLQQQMATKEVLFHAYVNDSDMVGTHLRKQSCHDLTTYMAGDGKDFTNPDLDLNDFLNLEFCQDYDGRQLQIPDQQFPILYWFRHDLFTNPELMAKFKEKYKYELGVPLTWAAYEDIAEFFSKDVKTWNGKPIYGHLDYGKPDISLGWRFTDAWLSLAGCTDAGLPNGKPVDEWGIRVENGVPVGSTMDRGGALDSPAAVYALTFFIDMIKKYGPPNGTNLVWGEVGPIPGEGQIAQTIYYCGTFSSFPAYTTPGSPVCDASGKPLWRLAPQPKGKYWKSGMKVGYQDVGSWTLPSNVTGKELAAAWLWSQFCVSKTVCLKKFTVGNTPIRKSDVFADYWTPERSAKLGGLIEFYRSPARKEFTATGLNVPDYPVLQQQWYQFISKAVSGEMSAQDAMTQLAQTQDNLMKRMRLPKLSPKFEASPKGKEYWLKQPGAPEAEIQGRGEAKTISYEKMLEEWKAKELR